MRRQKGFSLVELLIVVAVILIIAAIAVPNLIRSRRSANEASAATSVRTITNAEIMYSASYPQTGYTCTLAFLGPYKVFASETEAGLIDDVLATGTKANYDFSITDCNGSPVNTFFVTANPRPGGIRKFCADQTGIVRFDPGTATCTASSQPI